MPGSLATLTVKTPLSASVGEESKLSKIQRPRFDKSGVIVTRISNASCFIKYDINRVKKTCRFKIFSRIRPGYIEKIVYDIDVANFNVNEQISLLQLKV